MIVFEDIKCISSIFKKILWDFSTGTKRAMGKSIDIAFDLLKVCSYFAIGGSCFYLLSGGKLPFQAKDDAQHETMTPMHAGRQCNAMTNNDKQTKKDEVSQFKSSDHASWSESTEKDLKRHLKEKSICGGFAGLTPECLAKMKEIEKKKESFKERL